MNLQSFYDLKGQKQRIQQIYKEYLKKNYFEDHAAAIQKELESDSQQYDKLIRCYVLLQSGDDKAIQMANRYLHDLAPYHFCQFSPVTMLEMLFSCKAVLSEENICSLEEYLIRELPNHGLPEFDFVGVNDNFPLLATYMMFAGGIYFCQDRYTQIGKKRLHQLAAILSRRGSLSEFNSPHYYLMEITPLALISERVSDPEIRELALQCECRLWTELLGRAMPWASTSAGPYSRAYTTNFNGSTDVTRLLYILLGQESAVYPNSSPDNGKEIHTPFLNHIPYVSYHCPCELVEWYQNRSYPHEYFSTYEANSSTDGLPHGKRKGFYFGAKDAKERDPYQEEDLYEYPSVEGTATTYMQENYTLGTATREWHNGLQCYSFVATYKKQQNVINEGQLGYVFSKYIINDKLPWQPNEYEQFELKESGFNSWDMGRKLCLQEKNTAMVLYKPKAFASKEVTSMRTCLFFPHNICNPVEEIWLGSQKIQTDEGCSVEPCSVYISDGQVYMAIHPLQITDYGRDYAVKVKNSPNGYMVVSFYNYEGEEKDFATRGFLLTQNGFVFEIHDKKDFSSFQEFREAMEEYQLTDTLQTNTHVRQTYQRIVEFERAGVSLSCECSPVSEGVRYLMVNHRPVSTEKLRITGLDTGSLPFMD